MASIDKAETSVSTLWWRIAGCVLGLLLLGRTTLEPLYALAVRSPATLPPRIRAIEGDVLLDNHWRRDDDGAYVVQTTHGKTLTLYCGPWPYEFRCLHGKGLEAGAVYRLTIAYGAQVFPGAPDGATRNVITHAMYGDYDLVTPAGQLRAWNETVTVYNARRGGLTAMKLDGLFWTLQLLVGAVYAMFVVALVKNGRALTRLRADKRRV